MVEGRRETGSDVVRLIDLALNRPISNAAKTELQSFKTQAEAGTLDPDDRKYAIKLCQWLLAGTGERATGSDAVVGVATIFGGGVIIGVWLLVMLLIYGVIVIIFRYAFGVELWNPFH